MKLPFLLCASILALSACGDRQQPSTPQPAQLFKPQREALGKAKEIEQTEAQHAEELKREEEKQTQ